MELETRETIQGILNFCKSLLCGILFVAIVLIVGTCLAADEN